MDHPSLFFCARSPTASTAGRIFALDGPAPASSEHLGAYLLCPRTLYLRIFYNEADAHLWVAGDSQHATDEEAVLEGPHALTIHSTQAALPPEEAFLRTFAAGAAPVLVDLSNVEITGAFFRALGGSTSADGVRVVGVPRHTTPSNVIDVDQLQVQERTLDAAKSAWRSRSSLLGNAAGANGRARANVSTKTWGEALSVRVAAARSVFVQEAEQTPSSVPSWNGQAGGSFSSLPLPRRGQSQSRAGYNSATPVRHRVSWSYGGPGGWRGKDGQLDVAHLPPLRLSTTLGSAAFKVCRQLARRTSVFLSGPSGCGKTYLVKDVVEFLGGAGAAVTICGSTGVAAAFGGGTTVHAWAGYTNGDADVTTPLDVVLNKVIPLAAKKRM